MRVGSNKGVLISAKLFSAANGGSLCMLHGVDIVKVRPTFTGQYVFNIVPFTTVMGNYIL